MTYNRVYVPGSPSAVLHRTQNTPARRAFRPGAGGLVLLAVFVAVLVGTAT